MSFNDPFEFCTDTDFVPTKPGPVVNKRKREGIQLCKIFDPAKPPAWRQFIVERKLDCYRGIARVKDKKAEVLTSTGLPHWNVQHIIDLLEYSANRSPKICNNIVLDGELMHDYLPFDLAGGILRQHDPNPKAKGFRLHAWDILPVEEFDNKICSKKLFERKKDLSFATNAIGYEFDNISTKYVLNMPFEVANLEGFMTLAKTYVLEDGEEGVVGKDIDGLYEYKKSGVWLKWKPEFEGDEVKTMKEGDFSITGIKMGKGKHIGRVGAILIEGYLLEDGNISPQKPDEEPEAKLMKGKAGTGFNDAERIQFNQWNNEGTLVGRTVEVKYQELSSKGKVRFPVFSRLRPDRD
jgi:ATP-dependent DNA ligase